ncbi:MAG: DNA alkylation repair protein [Bernardetiaceae bacterium]|jgi:3-methyladenine DNA glycosylase AlkD|nr:DNA alkylation repair protein [Bernardetiaceae bacterium]
MNPAATWAEAVAQELDECFALVADPTKAVPMRAYMKNQFEFWGIPAPQRRQVSREFWPRLKAEADQPRLLALALTLWQRPQREAQYVACDALADFAKCLDTSALPTLEHLLAHRTWWDVVDTLAPHVYGPLARACPAAMRPVLDQYCLHPNLWHRRVALLHQFTYRADTDAELLFAYCAANARHPEFFVQKAVGWALRQYANIDAPAVRRFVAQHPELAPLSRREALKRVGG